MTNYDKAKAIKNKVKEAEINSRSMKAPNNHVPVYIRPGLIVYTNCESKIEAVKLKFAGR